MSCRLVLKEMILLIAVCPHSTAGLQLRGHRSTSGMFITQAFLSLQCSFAWRVDS